jgi:hypothetical protein
MPRKIQAPLRPFVVVGLFVVKGKSTEKEKGKKGTQSNLLPHTADLL